MNRWHPFDVYRQLDWLTEAWTEDDEYQFTRRIARLERTLNQIPPSETELRAKAQVLVDELGRHRLHTGDDWRTVLVRLRTLIANTQTPRGG